MNERFQKLFDGIRLPYEVGDAEYTVTGNDLQKFAELIVRECAQYMYEHYPHSLYEVNYMRKHMGDADWNKPIKEHFGVEP